jgi:hypothetical protein
MNRNNTWWPATAYKRLCLAISLALLSSITAVACSQGCQYRPINDGGVGGAAATGGGSSTGKVTATDTGTATATATTTGTASSTASPTATATSTATASSTCKVVRYPSTPAPVVAGRQAPHHKVTGRHYRHPGRARATQVAQEICSNWLMPNSRTPLNQIDGSCTGHMGVGLISTAPWLGVEHFNETDALAAYQGGTCVDNGCAFPCTCASCPKAYCPATHANDVGSIGSSVLQWMVNKGWLKGYTTADTVSQLIACLADRPAGIGIDWYNSMWDTNRSTGEIQVSLASGFVGGHEPYAVSYDAIKSRVWIYNSWGKWGWCFPDQESASTPSDGTGCGYGWIAVSNLPKLKFDGDCPEL